MHIIQFVSQLALEHLRISSEVQDNVARSEGGLGLCLGCSPCDPMPDKRQMNGLFYLYFNLAWNEKKKIFLNLFSIPYFVLWKAVW